VTVSNQDATIAQLVLAGDTQSVLGTGQIVLTGVSNSSRVFLTSASLTVGPDVTIRGYGSINQAASSTLANQGTVVADQAGRLLWVNVASLTNQGTLEAKDGGLLQIAGLTGDLGRATLTGTGSNLVLAGSNYVVNQSLSVAAGQTLVLDGGWSNDSTINLSGGQLYLNGTFTTADVGAINRSGGAVRIGGTLNNGGSTLALNAATGTWTFDGGTIRGGVITTADTAILEASGFSTGGTLDGVTLNGIASVSRGATLTVTNGLTLNGSITLTTNSGEAQDPARVHFATGTQSLLGTGEIVLGGQLNASGIVLGGTSLTVGPDITIRGYGSIVHNHAIITSSLNQPRIDHRRPIRAPPLGQCSLDRQPRNA
jgi:hypothetical protein